ncbi:MAG: type II toxin-antitoxin system Phd/YefM family antitoxin [Firmicutes bacterium]|nr:type II toxin-antitoxin system Phd/YefM family antitoxin [Bacillota bacterium]
MGNPSLRVWQLQTAKNRFSEVVNNALQGHPQLITKNGKPAVYVVSSKEYESLTKRRDLKSVLLSSPHKDLEIPIQRQPDRGRDVQI